LALAQRNATRSDTQHAAARLARYEIRAPFAGVVVNKAAQPGEIISPMSAGGGFTRTGICTIVDMSSLEVEVDVSEAYIARVSEGQRVEAVLDAYPGVTFPAQVIATIPTADRSRATVRVRIGFDRLDPRILPEMAISVRFLDKAS
jgi:multidrug resistance efflux pump